MTRDMQHMTCGGGGKTSIGATIRIGREIRCLPYAGFLFLLYCHESEVPSWGYFA